MLIYSFFVFCCVLDCAMFATVNPGILRTFRNIYWGLVCIYMFTRTDLCLILQLVNSSQLDALALP